MMGHANMRMTNECQSAQLSFPASFRSPSWEQNYRQYYLKANAKQSRIFLFFALIPFLGYGYVDYRLFAFSPEFYKLLTMRTALSGLLIAAAVVLGKMSTVRNFDRIWGVLITLACIFVIQVNLSRNTDFLLYPIANVFFMLGILFLVPCRFSFKLVAVVLFAVVDTGVLATKPGVSSLYLYAVPFTSISIIVIGAWGAGKMEVTQRQQFFMWRRAKQANADLDAAMRKIKTLKGLLPICAKCKKIRDDQGHWHPVEIYVGRHSDTSFTHGLCPDCMIEALAEIENI